MVNLKELEKSSHKNVIMKLNNGETVETYIEEYVRKETDDEEPMLFYDENIAIQQSEIKSIEILD